MNQDDISFDLPKNRSNVIKVIGVGGGGSNAVNYMYKQGFNGVDFVVCNTDAQALHSSPVPNKVQLGVTLTEGLGAGARPEIGGEAAQESLADLESMLSTNTKMLFLTAGMGGGTGTGAAPVIAKLASKLGILTVGIVTMPFKFEGDIRLKQAQAGMEELQGYVDSMIVINNNKLRDVYGNLGLKAGFAKADEVLATAAKGISEVITTHSGINIDLHDAKTVLEKSGTAIMGAAVASGEDRAIVAITKALDSPLLNDNSIRGAKNVLLLIVSGESEITLDEIGEINEYIQDQSGGGSNIIMGAGEEEGLGDSIRVTVVATGFSRGQQKTIIGQEEEKIVHSLDEDEVIVEEVKKVQAVVAKVEEPKTLATEGRIIHKLEDEEEELISSQRVVHTLVEEVEEEVEQPIEKSDALTIEEAKEEFVSETSRSIMDIADEDIVIQDVGSPQTAIEFEFDFGGENTVSEATVNEVEEIKEVVEKKVYDLGDIEDEFQDDEAYVEYESKNETFIENDAPIVEAETKTATFVDGSKRYNLADYEEIEKQIESAKPDVVNKVEEVVEPEMQIHIVKSEAPVVREVAPEPIIERSIVTEAFVDPTDVPLSKKDQIGRERRERLKRFNHNFKTRSIHPSNIDDLEKQPAYKRAGIDLSSDQRNSASRYSLGSNADEDVVIRRNNSFLHDNVD